MDIEFDYPGQSEIEIKEVEAETTVGEGNKVFHPREITNSSFFNTILWYFYDAADTYWNTITSSCLTTMTMIMMIQIRDIFKKDPVDMYSIGMLVNTATIVISHFIAAILGPFLGALSDTYNNRKIAVLLVLGIISVLPMTYIAINHIKPAIIFPKLKKEKIIKLKAVVIHLFRVFSTLIFYGISNSSYQLGRMFYDTQIPFVLPSKRRSLLQGIGAALSFFGSLIAVILTIICNNVYGLPTTLEDDILNDPTTKFDVGALPYSLLVCGIGTLVMGYPYIFHRETHGNPDKGENTIQIMKKVCVDLGKTFWEIIRYPNALLYFAFWFFFTDAANTIQGFSSLTLMSMCGLNKMESDLMLLGGIICAIVFGFLASYLIDLIGPKYLGFISLASWYCGLGTLAISGLKVGSKVFPRYLVYLNCAFYGLGMGTIWTVGRQFLVELAPPEKLAQYTGFAKICGRVSSMISPVLFAVILRVCSNVFGLSLNLSYRIAKIPLLIFLIIATILLCIIRGRHTLYKKGFRAPYNTKKKENIKSSSSESQSQDVSEETENE